MGHCNTSQWLTGCLHVAPFFCVDSWVAHLDVTNTHTFWKEWKSWMWMQLCVQLETCAVKIHKNALIHRNGSPDFSNQSNTIQNNKKEKRWGDKCWQSFARLLRSMMVLLFVQAQPTPTMPNSTICWTSAARWNPRAAFMLFDGSVSRRRRIRYLLSIMVGIWLKLDTPKMSSSPAS